MAVVERVEVQMSNYCFAKDSLIKSNFALVSTMYLEYHLWGFYNIFRVVWWEN